MSTYFEVLKKARKFLKNKGIEDADVDAWYLMSYLLDVNRASFFNIRDEKMPEDKIEAFHKLVYKRSQNFPIQYIIGMQEFMGLEFVVNKDVLIPRQDTETLVEEVLKYVHRNLF